MFGAALLPLAAFANTVVSNTTVSSGQVYQAQDPVQVSTSGTVLVQSGGIATFRGSGSVSLQPGFTASSGGFFHASIVESFIVPLAWPAASGSVTGYNVYRNGTKLNGSALTVTSYTDTTALAGTTYTYVIKAVISGSESTVVTYTVTTAGSLEVFTPLVH
jgi:hypothetical protein